MATQHKEKITRGSFPENQTVQLWKARKVFSWGIGWSPIGEFFGKEQAFRLNITNKGEFDPQEGEIWEVKASGWRHKDGDIDANDKQVIYVDAVLLKKVEKRHINNRREDVYDTISRDSIWRAVQAFKWGMGFKPVKPQEFDDILPGLEKTFRLNVTAQEELITLEVGQKWNVHITNWFHRKDEVDSQNRHVVYLNAILKSLIVEEEAVEPVVNMRRRYTDLPIVLSAQEVEHLTSGDHRRKSDGFKRREEKRKYSRRFDDE